MVMNPANQRLTPIQTRYKGQKWRCGQCGIDHVGGCKKLKEFYAAKDVRDQEKIDMKILSDSTLRQAEQVGFRADVLCMTRAGVWHLANALQDDAKIMGREAVGLSSGGTTSPIPRRRPLQNLCMRWIRGLVGSRWSWRGTPGRPWLSSPLHQERTITQRILGGPSICVPCWRLSRASEFQLPSCHRR